MPLQVLQQIDDLRLDRDVERRDRLVAHDQLRLDRERARDADALALAAGEFVRIAAHVVGLQADRLEQFDHAIGERTASSRRELVDGQRLADDRADRHARIERGERVLEDDLHVAAERAERSRRRAAVTLRPSNQISPAVGSISRRMQRPVVDLPEPDSPTSPSVSPLAMSKLTLSTACTRLGFAGEEAAADREVLGQVLDAQERLGHRAAISRRARPARRRPRGRRRHRAAAARPGGTSASRSGSAARSGSRAAG